MTLGDWFREYVYIPLGGNRVGRLRLILNLFIVWFLTGFWHGAEYNFILWGIYFFVLTGLEKIILIKYLNKYKVMSHIYAILAILFGWALFAFVDLNNLRYLFNFNLGTDVFYYLRNYLGVFILAILSSTKLIEEIYIKIKKNTLVECLVLMSIFVLSVAYLVDSTYNPFLYFRF